MANESQVSELIGLIYDAAAEAEHWPIFLNRLADICGAGAANLNMFGRNHTERWGINPRTDPNYTRSYVDHYHAVDTHSYVNLSGRPGVVDTNSIWEITPSVRQTEFYNEWMQPQQIAAGLSAIVHAEQGRTLLIAMHSRKPLTTSHATLLQRLLPHVERSFQLNLRLARLDADRAASIEVLERLEQGVVLVDAESEVLFANRSADELLHADRGLRAQGGKLKPEMPADTVALQALIAGCGSSGAAAGSGGSLVLSRGLERTPLSLSVMPVRDAVAPMHRRCAAAIVFVTDPDRTAAPARDHVRDLFGLTQAEAALAVELIEGDGLQAIATRLGVTRETARTHLRHIFDKTGIRSQAELVRVIVASTGGLRRD